MANILRPGAQQPLPGMFPGLQGPQFIPGEGLPMLQDGSSPVGSAPGEEWLERLKTAGEKYRALQDFLDQAQGGGQDESIVQGPEAPYDPMDPEGPTPKDGPQMIPGYGVAIAGLADLILGREEDYDPYTELPPERFPSMLDKVAQHNRAAQAFRVGERHRREDRGEDEGGRRSRERNVLLGTLLPHLIKDDGDGDGRAQTQSEKVQGVWGVLRNEPWFQALSPEEQQRALLDVAGVGQGRQDPKTMDEIEREAYHRAIGTQLGSGKSPDEKDPDADEERKLFTRRYEYYLEKGEGGSLFPTPLSPEEAEKRARTDVEHWRRATGRPSGGTMGQRGGGARSSTAPGTPRDFDTEGHLFVGPGGEILFPGDEGYQGDPGGGGQGLGDLSDPRVAAAYRTITGARGYPPQPSAPMSGFGDVREREAMMAGLQGPGMPGVMGGASTTAPPMGGMSGPGIGPPMAGAAMGVPPGAPPAQGGNLMKALAGFHLFVQQGGDEAKARLKFYDKYGVDPYSLEQAPGPGR